MNVQISTATCTYMYITIRVRMLAYFPPKFLHIYFDNVYVFTLCACVFVRESENEREKPVSYVCSEVCFILFN